MIARLINACVRNRALVVLLILAVVADQFRLRYIASLQD